MSHTRSAEFADPPDWRQLRVLLAAILKSRTRTRSRFGRTGRPRGLIFQVAMYAVMGGLAGAIAFLGVDLFSYELVMFGLTLFISGLAMVAESGELLFGANEFDVLGHRPIGARTMLLARSLALFTLTALMAVSLNLGPLVFGLWIAGVHPWFPLVHLLTVLLLSLFCAAAVVFAYALLTRLVGRERFEGIASWLQLAVTVILILGYQVVPRLIDRTRGVHVRLDTPWLALFPPAWFAALASLAAGSFQDHELVRVIPMAAAALVVTAALAIGAIARLAGDYVRRLTALAERPARVHAADPAPRLQPEPAGGGRLGRAGTRRRDARVRLAGAARVDAGSGRARILWPGERLPSPRPGLAHARLSLARLLRGVSDHRADRSARCELHAGAHRRDGIAAAGIGALDHQDQFAVRRVGSVSIRADRRHRRAVSRRAQGRAAVSDAAGAGGLGDAAVLRGARSHLADWR